MPTSLRQQILQVSVNIYVQVIDMANENNYFYKEQATNNSIKQTYMFTIIRVMTE